MFVENGAELFKGSAPCFVFLADAAVKRERQLAEHQRRLAEAQERGGEVAFVDAEHALDPAYARALGVRVEDMPDPLMQKIRYLDKLIDELAKGRTMERILRK